MNYFRGGMLTMMGLALCFGGCVPAGLEQSSDSAHSSISTTDTQAYSPPNSSSTPTPSPTPSPTPRPTPPPIDGWTSFTPSADTNVIYVSQSGVYNCVAHAASSIADPFHPPADIGTCRTADEAQQLARHGFPDWVLFKRGDIWFSGIGHWKKFGRGEHEMLLLGAYGSESLDRPLFKTGNSGVGVYVGGGGGAPTTFQHFALVGLAFYAHTRDPKSPEYAGPGDQYGAGGYYHGSPGENLLIEDCLFSNYSSNIIIQTSGVNIISNVRLRRNVIADAWSLDCDNDPIHHQGHSQGLFTAHIHGLLIEENIFDHNGWADNGNLFSGCWSGQTMFNHNMYLSQEDDADLVIRGNITSRAAHHGLQLRPGGIAEDNLFANDPLAMFTAHSDSIVRKNVVVGGADMLVSGEKVGRGWGIDILPTTNALVEDNIVANKNPGVHQTYSHAYEIGSEAYPSPSYNVTFRNNIAYNWKSPSLVVDTANGATPLTNLRVEENQFQEPITALQLVYYADRSTLFPHTFTSNTYFTVANPASWFLVYDPTFYVRYADFGDWTAWIGETGGAAQQITYPDPNRTIETYQASLGEAATFDAFIARAREQRRGNYWPQYTAHVVNNYIRAGFGR